MARIRTRLGGAAPVTRRFAMLSMATAGALGLAARTQAATLPAAASLASALGAALLRKEPLVVMASADHCPFCMIVRDNYLGPMLRDGRVHVVQLDLGSRAGVVDFAGGASTPDALLRRWHVDVAPTLLFFGAGGREVAPRLAGVSPDFYSAYLEQRLETARRAVGRKSA